MPGPASIHYPNTPLNLPTPEVNKTSETPQAPEMIKLRSVITEKSIIHSVSEGGELVAVLVEENKNWTVDAGDKVVICDGGKCAPFKITEDTFKSKDDPYSLVVFSLRDKVFPIFKKMEKELKPALADAQKQFKDMKWREAKDAEGKDVKVKSMVYCSEAIPVGMIWLYDQNRDGISDKLSFTDVSAADYEVNISIGTGMAIINPEEAALDMIFGNSKPDGNIYKEYLKRFDK